MFALLQWLLDTDTIQLRSGVYLLTLQMLKKSSPITGLEWPRGFQEVKVPRFRDNGTGRW